MHHLVAAESSWGNDRWVHPLLLDQHLPCAVSTYLQIMWYSQLHHSRLRIWGPDHLCKVTFTATCLNSSAVMKKGSEDHPAPLDRGASEAISCMELAQELHHASPHCVQAPSSD